jgi:hypothetical protein
VSGFDVAFYYFFPTPYGLSTFRGFGGLYTFSTTSSTIGTGVFTFLFFSNSFPFLLDKSTLFTFNAALGTPQRSLISFTSLATGPDDFTGFYTGFRVIFCSPPLLPTFSFNHFNYYSKFCIFTGAIFALFPFVFMITVLCTLYPSEFSSAVFIKI